MFNSTVKKIALNFKVGDFIVFDDGALPKDRDTQSSYECVMFDDDWCEACFAVPNGHLVDDELIDECEGTQKEIVYAALKARRCGYWWLRGPEYKIKYVIQSKDKPAEEDYGGLSYL